MSDYESLYLTLVVIYLLDCLVWLRTDCVAFRSLWPGRATPAFPGEVFSTREGGPLVLQPLPPLGQVWLTSALPLQLSPQGAVTGHLESLDPANRRSAAPPTFLSWTELGRLTRERHQFLLDGQPVFQASSSALAQWFLEKLQKISQLDPSSRSAALEELTRERLDSKGLQACLKSHQALKGPVVFLANVLFLYLFVIWPLLAWFRGFGVVVFPLFIGLLGILSLLSWNFVLAHRQLHPSLVAERRLQVATFFLAAPLAVRAGDELSRDVLYGFHPIAAGVQLLDPQEAKELASRVLRDLLHPLGNSRPKDEKGEVLQWWRALQVQELERFLLEQGWDRSHLLKAPAPDAESQSSCPRCLSQFSMVSGACPDCLDIQLVGLFSPSEGQSRVP